MILMGFNPDQEEEEENPPAPSNSQSGLSIREDQNYKQTLRDQRSSRSGIRVRMCRSLHRASNPSVPPPPPGFDSCFRVFTGRHGPSVPSPRRSSPGTCDNNTGTPARITQRDPSVSVRNDGAQRSGSRAGLLQISAGSAEPEMLL